jgi:hypothetical protein
MLAWMAVWQFPLLLVPRHPAESLGSKFAEKFLTDDGWDVSDLWRGPQSAAKVERVIDKHLSLDRSGTDDALTWGSAQSHTSSLLFYGDTVEDIWFRVDMSDFDVSFVRSIVDIAMELDCLVLVMEKQTLIEPEVDINSRFANASRAKTDA